VTSGQSGHGQTNLTQNLRGLYPDATPNIHIYYENLKYQMTIFDIRFLIQAD